MLVSHEFMHLRIREFQTRETIESFLPYWINEGIGNGFGFGFVEHFQGLSRQTIAARTASLRPEDNKIGAFLGLRYYDVPLSLEGSYADAFPYPRGHPAYVILQPPELGTVGEDFEVEAALIGALVDGSTGRKSSDLQGCQ